MDACYVPLEQILKDIEYLSKSDQVKVLTQAGVELNIAYPRSRTIIDRELMQVVSFIITRMYDILTMVFRCGTLEYSYIHLAQRGIIYVVR